MGKAQDLKSVSCQDILATRACLKDMKDLYEALHFMNHFLDSKVMRELQEMKACGEIFEVVYQNFGELLLEIEESLSKKF
ncbi:hypothetical protein [Enterococcus sp. AZ126]|uniref:hypothetical protein n=1 Tax=Enterococcus sp. AZ126 TaxID=2774635 RepID=UPI003F227CBE